MREPKLKLATLFILFAVIFMGLGAYIFIDTQNLIDKSLTAKGTVIRLSEKSDGLSGILFCPIVKFETGTGDSIEFASKTSSDPPSYNVGEIVSVLYDPNNPKNAEINSFSSLWFFPILFLGVGIICSGIGASIFIARMKLKKKTNWFLINGQKIKSEMKNIELDRSSNYFGQNPYRIYSQYHDRFTNIVHVFKSEEIWFDPKKFIKYNTIDVYVDPGNFNNYYMDVSFLPMKWR